MSNWHSMEVDQVLKKLNTDPHLGLSVEEARSRLEKYGYNELKKEEKISPSGTFINQFKKILIIILLIAAVLSVLVPPMFGISIRACLISWFR